MLPGKRDKKHANRLAAVWSGDVPDHVIGVAWSADGALVAAAAVSGPIVLFHAGTGTATRTLAGHGFGTASIAFHPRENVLASVGQDGKVRLWDAAFGEERVAFDGGAKWVEKLAWSPDGHLLATAGGKKVRLWEYATGNLLREYDQHGGTVADLAWQPGTGRLAVAAYGGVSIYDPTQAEAVGHFNWKGAPLKLAWAPNGKMLAHGNQDATVHFWYADSGQDLHMSGYPTKVRELSWDFTGRFLATGGGAAVCVWDCAGKGPEGSTPKMLESQSGTVTAVAWQRRGFLVASADDGGRLCLYQPANRTPLVGGATFNGTDLSALAWSPDDKKLAVGSGSGKLGLFQLV